MEILQHCLTNQKHWIYVVQSHDNQWQKTLKSDRKKVSRKFRYLVRSHSFPCPRLESVQGQSGLWLGSCLSSHILMHHHYCRQYFTVCFVRQAHNSTLRNSWMLPKNRKQKYEEKKSILMSTMRVKGLWRVIRTLIQTVTDIQNITMKQWSKVQRHNNRKLVFISLVSGVMMSTHNIWVFQHYYQHVTTYECSYLQENGFNLKRRQFVTSRFNYVNTSPCIQEAQ